MSILIKNVLFDDKTIDIYIEGKEIKQIGAGLSFPADKILDGSRKAVIPGFVNAHTHAAMTLFRGFGDDMPLMPWLEQKIWPNEAKMTREDVYWGAKLACLEMIKSGTTTFFDMYHKFRGTADATEEMGLRGMIAGVCFDHFSLARVIPFLIIYSCFLWLTWVIRWFIKEIKISSLSLLNKMNMQIIRLYTLYGRGK